MSTPATPDTPFWTDGPKTGEERLRRIAGWTSIAMFLVWIGFSALAFVFALLMTWWPSRGAASVPIAEALRYE